ncbi:sodium/potassium/calcium exchanger 2-like isoform X1 [Solea solea]|uniref:sodium/potassium/calcium exchanger 2-like isoform X1 n=1 Tax=Solea solea TaxID=90069 RepID=UPI002729CC13|nr:sodium/potassium/calcium exchanger 2-like isoform X1 [Solea solea]
MAMGFMLPIRRQDMVASSSSALLGPHSSCPRRRYQRFRRKLRPGRILGFAVSVVVVCTVCSWSALSLATTVATGLGSGAEDSAEAAVPHRTLLQYKNLSAAPEHTPVAMPSADVHMNHGDYPKDYFTVQERREGYVMLHMFGMMYMFIALAIVCDEFFVPALTVITEKLEISDDVAGATFMAAGGSAPELFTSVIGVFISHSNVGIGTIVGSAVFNILFVIGMCALFSKEVLNLTWWPLFRDVSFYIIGLLMLIYFFLDNQIVMEESISLLLCYTAYVTFMKFNAKVELFIKSRIGNNQVKELVTAPKITAPGDDENKLMAKPRLQREGSCASLHNSVMRNSIFQLMIHTLDPLSDEGHFKEKASILHKMAKQKCKEDAAAAAAAAAAATANGVGVSSKTQLSRNANSDKNIPNSTNVAVEVTPPMNGVVGGDEGGEEEEDEDQPLSLAWPDTNRKRLTYLVILPIVLPLWITLPDVRRESSARFFPVTFLGAICWIAFFSYLMVWWAHQVGETFWITEEIMGLTILAAGTSIPDLITSVIVARKGLGDMAVSSSVGSNIFDITVGLPFPWLLYNIINDFKPIEVSSNGLFCAIVLLFIMLLFVIISIATCKWKMSKSLGLLMFLLYFVFLVVSVMLEDKIISCPITI